MYVALQHSVYVALKHNTQYAFTSAEFQSFTDMVLSQDHAIAKFFKSKMIKKIWDSKAKFFINSTMRAELRTLRHVFSSPDTFA